MQRKYGLKAESEADPMIWDLSGEAPAVIALTCTASTDSVLHIRRAATLAELDAPPAGLHHELLADIVAGVTLPVLVASDTSLPHGRAWVATGLGNYSLSGSRRAHS